MTAYGIIGTGHMGSMLAEEFIFKRNTPQLAAAGIKGMRIQFRLRSAWPGSNFMRQRLGCPAACGVGALPPFHSQGSDQ